MHADPLCAILIDVENLLGFLKTEGAMRLLDIASEFGTPTIRRAYGTWANPSVQERVRDLTLAGFELIHGYHPVTGKDAADVQMVVDAMDLLARVEGLQAFVLATGDSDFSPLFRKLRERGRTVVGVGPRGPLADFAKSSCSRYVFIDNGARLERAAPLSVPPAARRRAAASAARVEDAIEAAVRILDARGGAIDHAGLKSRLLLIDPAFDERDLGFASFREFAERIPGSETRREGTVWCTSRTPRAPAEDPVDAPPGGRLGVLELRTESYRSVLRSKGWRPAEAEHVVAVWRLLSDGRPRSKADVAAMLAAASDGGVASSAFSRAFDALYRADAVAWAGQDESGVSRWSAAVTRSDAEVLRAVDIALLRRLGAGLAERGWVLDAAAVLPLLGSCPDVAAIERLVDELAAAVEASGSAPSGLPPADGGA